MLKDYLAQRLYEYTIGKNLGYTSVHFSVQLFLLLSIYFKMYFSDIKFIAYILIFFFLLVLNFLIWLAGYLMIKTGFYEAYQMRSPIDKQIIINTEKETYKDNDSQV